MKKLLILGTTLTVSALPLNTSVNAQLTNNISSNKFCDLKTKTLIVNCVNNKEDFDCKRSFRNLTKPEKEKLSLLFSTICQDNNTGYYIFNNYDDYVLWTLNINTWNYSYSYYYYNDVISIQILPSLQDILNNPNIDSSLKHKLENKLGKIYEFHNIPINNNVNPLQNSKVFSVEAPNRLSTNFELQNLQNPKRFSIEAPTNFSNTTEIKSISNQNEILSPSPNLTSNYNSGYNYTGSSNFGSNIGNNITAPTSFNSTNVNYGGYENMIPQTNFNQNHNQISIPQNMNTNLQNLINR